MTGEDIVNGWRHYLEPGDSGRDRLACSTLKTAFDIRPAGNPENRDRKSLVMVPNPLHKGSRADPLYIYFEVYNLGLDSNGNTEYAADFTLRLIEGRKNLLQRVFGGGGKSSISDTRAGGPEKPGTSPTTSASTFARRPPANTNST